MIPRSRAYTFCTHVPLGGQNRSVHSYNYTPEPLGEQKRSVDLITSLSVAESYTKNLSRIF